VIGYSEQDKESCADAAQLMAIGSDGSFRNPLYHRTQSQVSSLIAGTRYAFANIRHWSKPSRAYYIICVWPFAAPLKIDESKNRSTWPRSATLNR
jgi:hypothetical protein